MGSAVTMTTTERIDASDSTAVKVQVLELIDVNSIENYLLLSTFNVLKMLCQYSSLKRTPRFFL